jgi:hypothetical protein
MPNFNRNFLFGFENSAIVHPSRLFASCKAIFIAPNPDVHAVPRYRRTPRSGAHRPVTTTECRYQFPSGGASRVILPRLPQPQPRSAHAQVRRAGVGCSRSRHELIPERNPGAPRASYYLPSKFRCGMHVTRHTAVSAPSKFGPMRAAGCHAKPPLRAQDALFRRSDACLDSVCSAVDAGTVTRRAAFVFP